MNLQPCYLLSRPTYGKFKPPSLVNYMLCLVELHIVIYMHAKVTTRRLVSSYIFCCLNCVGVLVLYGGWSFACIELLSVLWCNAFMYLSCMKLLQQHRN